jgi:hypothetical protein
MSYTDVLSMPVYERRFYLTTFIQENEKQKEKIETQQVNSNNSKGKRTTKVSGDMLKTKLKSGEIPNH